MSNLLIIYHSRTGGSRQMAQAAYEAATPEHSVAMLPASEANPDDVLWAKGVIFCCPENLAAISGAMKEFFDTCYYPLLGQIEGKPYATMICAGSDGENAARQIARIATGWRMREVQPAIIVNTNAQSPVAILAEKTLTQQQLAPCRELGQAMGAGLSLGIF
ncbi:flavodoxin family protein [Shimia abyssi]|uniref:NADPH-dependent FMN reductase n=1 Tax=Shimia abyssi TaxID=1662395 RepID=A0A2P8FIW0_9RHOB|nr:NAD(P)H-dependent oxidoreductase [Shimia abyssi]PSL21651.1 NADPH-dependent FMN reductase [Shimia abyssi]